MSRLDEIKNKQYTQAARNTQDSIDNNDIDWLIDVAEAANDFVEYTYDTEIPKGAGNRLEKLRKALEAGDE